jgi:3-deoxy-D-manno-octulosonate 8-phosphate phosphatase (KDO 8-P phosphatase)
MFERYCRENKLCDYITNNSGGNNALREISEVILGMLGMFTRTVEERMAFSGTYNDYLQIRNLSNTRIQELKY